MMSSIGFSILKKQLCLSYFNRWLSTGGGEKLKRGKLSYVFGPGDHKLTHLTLPQVLDEAVNSSADDIALVSSEQNIRCTFSELNNDVNKMASGLLSLGLCKGDRIAICAPNVYEWPVTLFAAAKAGLILVNINPAYQEKELEYSLSKVECKALVVSDTFKTQNFYKMLCSILPELEKTKDTFLKSKRIPSLERVILLANEARNGTITFNDVLNAGDSKSGKLLNDIEKTVQFDNPVNIQYTSGTTGSPKGAVLSHHSLVNNALFGNRLLGTHIQKPVICCPIPLYHTFGCVMGIITSVLFKNKCVLPSAAFDAVAVLDAVEKEKCTRILGAPTMYLEIINKHQQSKRSFSSVKQIVLGGAACPQQLLKDIRDKLKVSSIHEGYGTTETSPCITLNGLLDQDVSVVLSAYLRPLDFVEVKIVDAQQHVVPVNEQGEICVRGHNVFMGYWKDKKKTDEAIDATRWYHTGDLGIINEDGRVKVVGRIKDMVLRGGENIYPVEVENFLHTHPSISEVHICGVPDDKMGEELCAWVKLKEGEKTNEQDIKDFCKNKISHFKVPRYVLFVENFPKTITGKVQKFIMRDVSMKQLGLPNKS